MPLVKLLGKRDRSASPEPEEMEAPARQPMQLPVEDKLMAQGRPHQAFVEDEARKYWQDMVQARGLNKPDQQTLREAAMPILLVALRKRTGSTLNPALNRAHMAVNALQLRLAERGRLRQGCIQSEQIPNFFKALLQLADDAGWLEREIPLQDHPAPRHPPIHYTIDPKTGKPIATEKSLIRGDYVYDMTCGSRLTQDEYIYPWRDPDTWPSLDDLTSRGWKACYIPYPRRTGPSGMQWVTSANRMPIRYHWIEKSPGGPTLRFSIDTGIFEVSPYEVAKGGIYFSPRAPTKEDLRRRRMNKDDFVSDEFLRENSMIIFY